MHFCLFEDEIISCAMKGCAQLLEMRAIFSALIFAVLANRALAYTSYNTSSHRLAGKLNVHLVPHTHDGKTSRSLRHQALSAASISRINSVCTDVGWLKTIDQYFTGSNNTIQLAGVEYILSSLARSLDENRDRTAVYNEVAFFARWWRGAPAPMRDRIRRAVSSGQLEFVNGGWCQHDEAAAHYVGMLDQTTLGHRFLRDTLGVVPRVGWQIDPFGHSMLQATHLGVEAGFEAVMLGRTDYQDLDRRKRDRELEMVWRPSGAPSAQVFASESDWVPSGRGAASFVWGADASGSCASADCRMTPELQQEICSPSRSA